jgi:cysteinyl-tRNA synthetase
MADWLRRALEQQGYQVTHVKNITDVGHMRQEVLERGEDRIIAAARAEGKSPSEIADFYTQAFLADEAKLNITPAHIFPKATEHVDEMIKMAKALVERGYAYVAGGNIYFSVPMFADYGKLSGNRTPDAGATEDEGSDPSKQDPRDFTLWKAAEGGRLLKWASPWGDGFPGWHIECSAMAIKYLGPHLDIHTGGVDNIFPHHEDEIAQSEAVYGAPFARHWVHAQHLLVDGLKMAKSTGNTYILSDLEQRGFEPMAFRYLSLTVGYRHRMNFTWQALKAAQRGLERLREKAAVGKNEAMPDEPGSEEWRLRFWDAINDDLNMPKALAIAWQVARHSSLSADAKAGLLREFDNILGLDLAAAAKEQAMPPAVQELVGRRETLRQAGRYQEAAALRQQIETQGFEVRDAREGPLVSRRRVSLGLATDAAVSSSREVPSILDQPATLDFSVGIIARDNKADIERCLNSVLSHTDGHAIEIIVFDNGSTDGTGEWLDAFANIRKEVRVIHADHNLGAAAGRNIIFNQSRGRMLVWLDPSIEAVGDIFTPLTKALADSKVGLIGPFGVESHDLHDFHEATAGDVDAIEGYLIACRRETVQEIGALDEKFRFYRHLDLDFSFACREKGYRLVALPNLPLVRHPHTEWLSLADEERDKLSKRNFYRFLHRWGHREDLLITHEAHTHGAHT